MSMPVRGLSTRAVQAEQTRQQILATAERLFAESGYEATSLQMIADELGLTKAAVYYHFRAKSDILHAAMLPGIERIERLLDEASVIRGQRARIDWVVSGFAEFLVQHRRYTVMASLDPTAGGRLDRAAITLRQRALNVLYGEKPSAAERLAYYTMFNIAACLPELVDLGDTELYEVLHSTMLRMLRVPSDGRPHAGLAR